jgi:hypothetical protein
LDKAADHRSPIPFFLEYFKQGPHCSIESYIAGAKNRKLDRKFSAEKPSSISRRLQRVEFDNVFGM